MKPRHYAWRVSKRGVSPLCAARPRQLDPRRETWTAVEALVTCTTCREAIRERRAAGQARSTKARRGIE